MHPQSGPIGHSRLRVGPLLNVERLLSSLGCEAGPVFDKAGLDPRTFLHVDERVDYLAASRLLVECARSSGCEHFGLLLGQQFLGHQLGVAWSLAQRAPDVGVALNDLKSFLGLHESGGVITLQAGSDHVSLGYAVVEPEVRRACDIYDFTITILCILMRIFCGSGWSPGAVQLSRKKPAEVRPYERFFRCHVDFDTSQSQLLFANKWLDVPLSTSDALDHLKIERQARRLLQDQRAGLALEVRDTLRRLISEGGQTNAASVAGRLGLHERTLNRRLRAEGTSYRQLRELVLQNLSLEYLESTDLRIGDIAPILGYTSTAAFDRTFQRWFGIAPTTWRCKSHGKQALA